ncbi:MAG: hypothetical protein IPL61_23705 [Myxococcales bacterium]|nr:hypothetical protein [Myxococcales bacterium]
MGSSLRRAASRALVVLVIAAVGVVALPSATAAMVTCCCGDHDAHTDCGCVDCPAGHAGDDGPSTPSVKGCKTRSGELTLTSASLLPPPVIAPTRELTTPAGPPRVPPLDDRAPEPPPSPPPRA